MDIFTPELIQKLLESGGIGAVLGAIAVYFIRKFQEAVSAHITDLKSISQCELSEIRNELQRVNEAVERLNKLLQALADRNLEQLTESVESLAGKA